mmetsp:Transcript_52319/g.131412  ORF Transcript_52319/g.131412 Transcript_52319/m.131412 type:complete len:293 (-) Transcript_52319:83-961(-)
MSQGINAKINKTSAKGHSTRRMVRRAKLSASENVKYASGHTGMQVWASLEKANRRGQLVGRAFSGTLPLPTQGTVTGVVVFGRRTVLAAGGQRGLPASSVALHSTRGKSPSLPQWKLVFSQAAAHTGRGKASSEAQRGKTDRHASWVAALRQEAGAALKTLGRAAMATATISFCPSFKVSGTNTSGNAWRGSACRRRYGAHTAGSPSHASHLPTCCPLHAATRRQKATNPENRMFMSTSSQARQVLKSEQSPTCKNAARQRIQTTGKCRGGGACSSAAVGGPAHRCGEARSD